MSASHKAISCPECDKAELRGHCTGPYCPWVMCPECKFLRKK